MVLSSPKRPRLQRVPQLGIRHLLGWTATTALVMGLLLGRVRSVEWTLLLNVAMNAAIGFLAFGVLLIAWHAIRRTLWPLQPGEWLVMTTAAALSAGFGAVVLVLIFYEFQQSRERDESIFGGVFIALARMFCAGGTAVAVTCLIGAIAMRRFRLWSAMTLGVAIVSALYAIQMFAESDVFFSPSEWLSRWHYLTMLGTIALLLLLAVVNDWRRHEPRYWFHWCGVAVTGVVIGFVGYVVLSTF